MGFNRLNTYIEIDMQQYEITLVYATNGGNPVLFKKREHELADVFLIVLCHYFKTVLNEPLYDIIDRPGNFIARFAQDRLN